MRASTIPTTDNENQDPPVIDLSQTEESSGEEESNEATSSHEEVIHSDFGNFNSTYMTVKFDIDKFDDIRDFGILRRKVKSFLSQHKILKAIEGLKKLSDLLTL